MGSIVSRRLAWIVLPAIALTASAGAAVPAGRGGTTVIALPAASAGDHLIAIASTNIGDADDAADDKGMPIVENAAGAPVGDLGLAAAALANGPVATGARRPGPGAGQAAVTTRAKARLPEPATWLMLIGGMYGIGAALRRRHRASEAAFTARLRSIAAGEDTPDRQ